MVQIPVVLKPTTVNGVLPDFYI